MFDLVKKLNSRKAVAETERLSEDSSILLLRSKDELPLFRYSFDAVRGAVSPLPLLDKHEVAVITDYIKAELPKSDMVLDICVHEDEILIDEEATESLHFRHAKDTRESSNVYFYLSRACNALSGLFEQAVGEKPGSLYLCVNQTIPEFQPCVSDAVIYIAQGRPVIGQAEREYELPTEHLLAIKKGFRFKTSGPGSTVQPSLTFLAY